MSTLQTPAGETFAQTSQFDQGININKQTLLLTELIESPHNCAQIVCTLHSEFEILLTVSGQ